jgi:hypothetical protein
MRNNKGTMPKFTTVTFAALISAAPVSAEQINGGRIQQNGKCWHGHGGAGESSWGVWESCAEKANRRLPSTARESRVPPIAPSEALNGVQVVPRKRPRPGGSSETKRAPTAERHQQPLYRSSAEHSEQINEQPPDQAAQDALFLECLRWKELQKSVK